MEELIKKILLNTNISFNKITKARSGFTNLVYFIDDKFVIKMSKDKNLIKKLEKEISIYKNITLDCIPKYLISGEIQDYKYLIISKLNGKSLYSIWHTLTKDERENCVKQIARILKDFNNQNTDFLANDYKLLNWLQFFSNELKSKVKYLKEMGYNILYIETYISQVLPKILSQNYYGLVYNDAHFDNFIYNNGKLSLIDFDRVIVCPIDYEMLIFKTMCDNPKKFASEEDESKIKAEDYDGIYELFKNEYPEMFENPFIEQRINLYQFNYLMGQAINGKKHEWIKKLLNNFNR